MQAKTPHPSVLEESITIHISETPPKGVDHPYGPHASGPSRVNAIPPDSGATVAIVKSAISAANNAYEAVQKATKQAVEIADCNFRAAAAAAVATRVNRVSPAEVDALLAETAMALGSAAAQGLSRRTALADQVYARIEEVLGEVVTVGSYSERAVDELIVRAARAIGRNQGEPLTQDPLQAARDRGKHQALVELQRPENLSLRDAATYSGRSDRAINEARLKGQLYALVPPGKQRGLRYPQWQFDAEADRLTAALAPFIEAGASCWVVHNFMQRPLEALGDVRPMDWIADASKPIESVVLAVGNRYAGEQGAA